MVPLTVEEYQRLRGLEGQLTELRTAKEAEIAAKEAERIKALADKGQVDVAFEELRKTHETKLGEATTKYADLERQVFSERKSSVIAQAFAGRTFVGATPEAQAQAAVQVRTLLESQFETARDGSGALIVRDKLTGRPAADVLKESLDSPTFAHFFAPRGNAGSGGLGGSTSSAPAGDAPKPGSLDFIAAEFKARQARYGSFGLTAKPR